MDAVSILKNGGVVVMPTDTIYGIVGSALNLEVVEKIYKLRKRILDKPMIILVGSIKDLGKFGIKLTQQQMDFLQNHWPNPLSVVLPINDEKFKYLHRGKNSLAFRMPKDEKLLDLLKQVGSLVAPSANFEGEKPSETIDEAKRYFRDNVTFYIDGGIIKQKPSTLIELAKDGSFKLLRQGDYKLV
ncbi:threonylcarbamoyl-AMP synthase [Candidatus Daviesbacteria bacterium RIFCSPLOWO2_01_FULL_39_12]|uniref:L-threonylcarbamoyladenylate synthase n=1 Tax=Candidatus Daviesbacteria bacterium RIFCSPLOWO2_01_FULL_39_12 TaxID=1797785 RepID=A0A1F5KQI9_9BACT|nr:MAG: threonylcarbamoyl-AMP synthase [Candidatus Daviesbacteria bacterium RIFCSPHIGHO2_02_FULL_39_8]OGE43178.1 MAG: threonylcarbamoyl-AMP synthase [Candidatus Daviesbacteria bacterium RIFCSPLOWO2_01_FULL_39_12]